MNLRTDAEIARSINKLLLRVFDGDGADIRNFLHTYNDELECTPNIIPYTQQLKLENFLLKKLEDLNNDT